MIWIRANRVQTNKPTSSFLDYCRIRRNCLYRLLSLAGLVIFSCFFFPYQEISTHLFKKNCTDHSITADGITFQCGNGQLGNKMFYYAVVYGLSRLNNRKGFIQKCNVWNSGLETMDQIFTLSLPVEPDLPGKCQRGHAIHFHITYPDDYNIPSNANILVGEEYPVSVTYFLHVRDEIRGEFQFRKKFVDFAESFLNEIKGSRRNISLVGVHVRRRDFLPHLKHFGKTEAPVEYFSYAMEYFRTIIPGSEFVVVSDDLDWCQKNIAGNDVHFARKHSSAAQDLAILSHCNHVIFDYGTYGFWGAFLAGGQSMYFTDGIVDNSEKGNVFPQRRYPPEWMGVSSAVFKVIAHSINITHSID